MSCNGSWSPGNCFITGSLSAGAERDTIGDKMEIKMLEKETSKWDTHKLNTNLKIESNFCVSRKNMRSDEHGLY